MSGTSRFATWSKPSSRSYVVPAGRSGLNGSSKVSDALPEIVVTWRTIPLARIRSPCRSCDEKLVPEPVTLRPLLEMVPETVWIEPFGRAVQVRWAVIRTLLFLNPTAVGTNAGLSDVNGPSPAESTVPAEPSKTKSSVKSTFWSRSPVPGAPVGMIDNERELSYTHLT